MPRFFKSNGSLEQRGGIISIVIDILVGTNRRGAGAVEGSIGGTLMGSGSQGDEGGGNRMMKQWLHS